MKRTLISLILGLALVITVSSAVAASHWTSVRDCPSSLGMARITIYLMDTNTTNQ